MYAQDYYDRPYIVLKLREALQNEKLLQQNHEGERDTYLLSLATARVLQCSSILRDPKRLAKFTKNVEKEIKALMWREKKNRQYRKIG